MSLQTHSEKKEITLKRNDAAAWNTIFAAAAATADKVDTH